MSEVVSLGETKGESLASETMLLRRAWKEDWLERVVGT